MNNEASPIIKSPRTLCCCFIDYNTFFSVALATEAGVTHVVPSRIHAVRSMGASQIQVVRFVVIPSVIAYVIQGMRISMGRAFATIVSAEILAANSGLGFLIFLSLIHI